MTVRVALIVGSLHPGGAERQVVNLARGLRARGVAVTVYVINGRYLALRPLLDEAGVPVRVVHKARRIDPFYVLRLARALRQDQPDIAHSFLFTANSYGRLAAILAGVPLRVASERNARTPFWSRVERWVNRALLPFTRQIEVNSARGRQLLIEAEGIPADKITLNRNGVDTTGLACKWETAPGKRPSDLPDSGPIVISISSWKRQKNLRLLLEAVAQVRADFPDVRLIHVGGQPGVDSAAYAAEMRALVAALGLDDATAFLGQRDDVPALLPHGDVFALSSDWEGTSNALLEAMACGLPVLTTDVGDCGLIVREVGAGVVAPPGDLAAFSEGLRLLLRDAILRERCGRAGAEWVRENASVERLVTRTLAMYASLL